MEAGDRHTLGLLLELTALAKEASETNSELTDRFHQLLQSVSNPNSADVAKDLPFKVRQFIGKSDELLRTLSLNGNIELARGAFEVAKRIYPNDRLVLLWGNWVVEEYEPLERLIAQLKTQRVSFETYFPPKKRERVRSRQLELFVLFPISIGMWLAIVYVTWATFHSIFQ